jgi:peptide deformylase
MTIHRIRLLGDPILRARCELITKPRSSAVRVILDDLKETLRDWQSRFGGGRAIAAPQIGAPVRMVYVEMEKPWPMINPEIVDVGNEDFTVWDDCFSFPNLLVRVSRAYRIRVRYLDPKGEEREIDLEGDRAELLQHEIDHLDGVLSVDRAYGPDPFCLREEWNRHYSAQGRYGEPEPRGMREDHHEARLLEGTNVGPGSGMALNMVGGKSSNSAFRDNSQSGRRERL